MKSFRFLLSLCTLLCLFSLVSCDAAEALKTLRSEPTLEDIIEEQPSISGFVTEVAAHSIRIEKDGSPYLVSTEGIHKDGMTSFTVGDEVTVYFDGVVAESYPMQIHTVYAITLKTPAARGMGS